MLIPEVTRHEVGVLTLYVRHGTEETELYKRAGEATTYRDLSDHDGPALLDGDFRTVSGDEGLYTLYHPHGGRMDSARDGDLDDPAVKLQRVPGEYVE